MADYLLLQLISAKLVISWLKLLASYFALVQARTFEPIYLLTDYKHEHLQFHHTGGIYFDDRD